MWVGFFEASREGFAALIQPNTMLWGLCHRLFWKSDKPLGLSTEFPQGNTKQMLLLNYSSERRGSDGKGMCVLGLSSIRNPHWPCSTDFPACKHPSSPRRKQKYFSPSPLLLPPFCPAAQPWLTGCCCSAFRNGL